MEDKDHITGIGNIVTNLHENGTFVQFTPAGAELFA